MTKAMPFLQKVILLSYDPRPFRRGLIHCVKKVSQSSHAAVGNHAAIRLLPAPLGYACPQTAEEK